MCAWNIVIIIVSLFCYLPENFSYSSSSIAVNILSTSQRFFFFSCILFSSLYFLQ
uniref:Uncharacterized protein n=1 Tax=Rhizophora mucronata TaxID=61149 RepID=A0A2P2PT03_RHIMU